MAVEAMKLSRLTFDLNILEFGEAVHVPRVALASFAIRSF
jgi:hypothetical protein